MHKIVLVNLCIIALVSTTVAQKRCCSAMQFEMGGFAGLYTSEAGKLSVQSALIPKIAVDFKGKKVALNENAQTNYGNITLNTLIDFNEKVVYIFNKATDYCSKVLVDVPAMGTNCISPILKFRSAFTKGSGSTALPAAQWATEPKSGPIVFIVTLQQGTCTPLRTYIQGTVLERSMAMDFGFYDFTEGIKDPSVFKVPSYCNHVPVTKDTGSLTDAGMFMVANFAQI